ncbi:MAG: hypothetical protein EHM42_04440, partial [Planctomycetaceae bacterium]
MHSHCRPRPVSILLFVLALQGGAGVADDKSATLRANGQTTSATQRVLFARPALDKGSGHRTTVKSGDTAYPVVVVQGTPYQMGYHLGGLTRDEIQRFVPPVLEGIAKSLDVTQSELQEVWSRTAAFADDRVEQELAGLADGAGLPLAMLQALHAVPLLMPYSCSSIAAWGQATEDGHLYQTRNLDWSLEIGAHEFPV